jgi:hypothetical protein
MGGGEVLVGVRLVDDDRGIAGSIGISRDGVVDIVVL